MARLNELFHYHGSQAVDIEGMEEGQFRAFRRMNPPGLHMIQGTGKEGAFCSFCGPSDTVLEGKADE